MSKLARYFLSGNNGFAEFSIDEVGVTLNGADIYFQGSSNVDSLYVGKGLSIDFTQSKEGVDAIYLSESLSSYTLYKDVDSLVLLIAATATQAKTVIKVSNQDRLIFTDGSILVSDLISAVSATIEQDATAIASSQGLAGFDANTQSAVFYTLAGTANLTTQGFEIIPEAGLANTQFGTSVSSAGDINGDGLDDLIAGAPDNASSPSFTGRAYVIFGKTDTNAVALGDVAAGVGGSSPTFNLPDPNSTSITGTSAAEIIVGAAGDDTLIGAGGADVLLGGIGNDVLVVNADNISSLRTGPVTNAFGVSQLGRWKGGTGIDTIRLSGSADLDLTSISQVAAGAPKNASRIDSIEKIDLGSDNVANRLTLNLFDVLDITEKNLFNNGNGWSGLGEKVAKYQLVINGTGTDSVDLADSSGWTKDTSVMNDGITYDIWNHNTAAAQLLIQQNVQVI